MSNAAADGDAQSALCQQAERAWSLNAAPLKDVTSLFTTAALELQVGQLIHVESFNLFDSMSALELMDPKMDSGMLVNGAPLESIAMKLAQHNIPLEFASTKDVLASINELLRCEAAWLDGQPLTQTLQTCVYMHKAPLNALLQQVDLENTSMASTLTLVMAVAHVTTFKLAHWLRNAVVRADIYEEEEFSFNSALDAAFMDSINDEQVMKMLHVAIDRLNLTAKEHAAMAKNPKKKKKKPLTMELLHPDVHLSSQLAEVLVRRLRLRHVLFDAFKTMGLAESLVDLSAAFAHFESAKQILNDMTTEAIEVDAECFSGQCIGFDPTLSRFLSSGSPPRDVTLPSMEKTVEFHLKWMNDMLTACQPPTWHCMEDLRIFLSDFSRMKPTIVPRSYVLLFLYMDKKIYGKHSFMDWLTESMVLNGVPSVLLSTQEGVQLSARTIETVYESLKLYLHGRSRQRTRIETLLEDWTILQTEAAAVDERFTTEMGIPKAAFPRYFTAWTLEESVVLMIHYVLLGLELELYAPSELCLVYWYLDYLLGSRLQNLNFTRSFIEKLKQMTPAGKQPPEEGDSLIQQRFMREIHYAEMLRALMRAYFQLYSAVDREQLIASIAPPYGSPSIRFLHRFACFQSIHFPAALSYGDFEKNSDFSPYPLDVIYKSADECFKVARVHGEQVLSLNDHVLHRDEVKTLIKVAISNSVQLARHEPPAKSPKPTKQTPPAAKVELDYALHAYYAVVKFPEPYAAARHR